MMILAFLSRIMVADLAAISKEYDSAVQLEFPGGSPGTAPARPTGSGSTQGLLPLASFEILHQMGRDDTDFAPRAAIRWSSTGKHEG
jgi:hypothetical protein